MSSLQNRAAKPKSKKKVTLVVSCVEKFLHDGSATPAMKKTVRKDLKKLKSEFESLINKLNKLSSAGENKAEKIKPNYHYVDMFKSIFDAVSKDIESNLKLIPKRKPGNEEDVKYFSKIVLDKAYDFMEFVENVEEIANLDPDKCKPNEADEKAKKALKSVQDSVSLSHLVPNSKVCHQEPEVLLVKEDLVGCHTQTS
jgi:hypothetical protein